MMDADEFRALIALPGGGYNRPAKDQLRATLTELQPEKLVGFTDQLALAAYAPTGRASAQRAPDAQPTRPAKCVFQPHAGAVSRRTLIRKPDGAEAHG
jgi:hypothetical protein